MPLQLDLRRRIRRPIALFSWIPSRPSPSRGSQPPLFSLCRLALRTRCFGLMVGRNNVAEFDATPPGRWRWRWVLNTEIGIAQPQLRHLKAVKPVGFRRPCPINPGWFQWSIAGGGSRLLFRPVRLVTTRRRSSAYSRTSRRRRVLVSVYSADVHRRFCCSRLTASRQRPRPTPRSAESVP